MKDPRDRASVAMLDKDETGTRCCARPAWRRCSPRSRDQCTAATRAREYQLPDFSRCSREEVKAQLMKIVDDPKVAVTIPEVRGPEAQAAPLTPQILKPIEQWRTKCGRECR